MFRYLFVISILLLVVGCEQSPYTKFVNDSPFLDGFIHALPWILFALVSVVGYFYLDLRSISKWLLAVPMLLLMFGVYRGYTHVNTPCNLEDFKQFMSTCPKYKQGMVPRGYLYN